MGRTAVEVDLLMSEHRRRVAGAVERAPVGSVALSPARTAWGWPRWLGARAFRPRSPAVRLAARPCGTDDATGT
ncbi:hypothetical protein C1701_12545 [Actinoalloteichus sp. AHMU CJ021]|nr:hypothetical protein C1701_12545 [Actinoalloteichus sp. AHMU CJ021]